MTVPYLLGWPLRLANALRQRRRMHWPSLPRPVISVGNIASGGRAKTPMTAALAHAALARGLRPAILSRGYKGAISARSQPLVLVGDGGPGACWQRQLSAVERRAAAPQWSEISGDEPAWLAATCPGVPVGIHPRRPQSAEAILRHHEVDLFLLDDGFQTDIERDLDLVLLDPTEDPPFARRSLCREGAVALRRADRIAVVLSEEGEVSETGQAWPQVRRRPAALRDLASGELVAPESVGAVVVAAAVARAEGVASLARELGLTVLSVAHIANHGDPTARWCRRHLRPGAQPLLVTEKDAVGWAGRRSPAGSSTLVLSMHLAGADPLADELLDALGSSATP
jgi:tetraacyldisaccharide 4'-kinase